jgi:penicillin-binding protein 1C
MQLARLIRPRTGGFSGKLREAGDALRLDAKLSKKEILELWLNNIPFGSNIEGLPAMGRARFGRSAAALDENRAALLAMVPRRPGRYDPAGNPEEAVRAALALSVRCGLGLREAALREAAGEAAQNGASGGWEKAPFFAPHFTGEAAASLRAAGSSPPLGSVRSTLDLGFQTYGEELLQRALSRLGDHRVTTGAIVAVENETGAIRVYVGSASWFDEENSGKIDGVRVINQPGSCLKPFLYALALDSGFGPQDILPDLPTIFGNSEAYIPANFNRRFNGPVRLRVALASSLNIPAVYTLERLGVGTFEDYLVSLGFDSIAASRGSHGTGLALGNGEVSLLELVRAFSVFPRGGFFLPLKYIEETENGAGRRRVMSPYAAWVISDVLSDRASRFTGFGPAPVLATPFPSMFKTGTANQFQHIWALGASQGFTVGVWMGNFSGETVIGRTGSSIPARIAAELLGALETEGPRDGPVGGAPPEFTAAVPVCALSGMAAGPYCGGGLREWLPPDRIPAPCTWHRSTGLVYPPEYQAWIEERFRSGRAGDWAGPGEKSGGLIRIPVSGSVYYLDPALPPEAQALRLETAGFGPEASVYIDRILQGSLNPAGVYALPLFRGRHRVTVEDDTGAMAWVDFEVR